ncbi:MAG: energy-coupling factor transporter transmembrane protein EcfT [Patiriisocius sp.]|jgi:energy-coupling factor transporter transmembrane protein EcfT
MKLFFERTESKDKTIIVFKPYSMYLLLAVLALMTAITFVPALLPYEHFVAVLMPIAAAVIAARIIFMYKVNREIQHAIRNNSVNINGGKLSAKKPLTFEITKNQGSTTSPKN